MKRGPATMAVVLGLVAGCGRATPSPPAPAAVVTPPPVRAQRRAPWDPSTAADHGIEYLARNYSAASLFDDPYITGCAARRSGCTQAYRELDHAILVLYWLPPRAAHDPRLARVAAHATRVVAHALDRWRGAALDREALDLYALFPYYFPGATTRAMVAEVVRGLDPAGDWEGYDAHGPAYRKVTDELWPILALARNHVDDATLVRALDRKRDEANRVLYGDWRSWPSTERFYALSHVYLALIWTEREGHDIGRYWPVLAEIEQQLAHAVADPELSRANAALEQALFVLSEGGYPDREALSALADEVAARQQPDGSWHAFEVAAGEPTRPRRKPLPAGFAVAHATLMALAALDRWSRWDQRVAQREWRVLAGPNPITRVGAGAPPPPVFRDVAGQRINVGFAMTKQADIDFVNELRMEPENAVVFFRDGDLEGAALDRIRDIRAKASRMVPSHRGITMERTRAGLQLHVALELYGPAATPAFAEKIARGIEQAWQGATGGVKVSTTVRVTIRDDSAAEAATALPVYVPDRHVMPSTQREGDTGDRPTTWPPWIAERTIAHEMGHYFGFPDAYHIDVRDGFYYLTYDRPDDLMSSPYGAVQREQLEQLVQAYRPKE